MFPYVSDITKTTTTEDGIKFNNGKSIHISSYFRGYQRVNNSEYEYWWTTTEGCNNPSSVFSLQSFVNNAKIIDGSYVDYVFNSMFSNKQPESYYETNEYITKRDIVYDNLTFIWGDADNGGLCCFKDSRYENKLSFLMINGFFNWSDGVNLRYGYYTISGGSAIDTSFWDMSRVQFRYVATDKPDRLDQFVALMCYPSRTSATTVTVAGLTMSPIYQYTVYSALADYNQLGTLPTDWYESDLGNDPISCFAVPTETVQTMYDPNHTDLQLLNDGYLKMKGNPYADAQIDDSTNPYYDTGFNDQGGGQASLDNNTDTSNPEDCDIDNNPIDVCNSNLVLMYNPTPAEISSFNDFLYSGITDSIANTLKKLTSDPLQYIVSLGLVHFTPPTSVKTPITFGGIDTGVSAYRISKQMKSFDFGYIDIKNEFKSFVDFNGRASIYLPYIGYRELDLNELRGSRIRLKYNVDMLTGSCIAYLHISRDSRGSGDCKIYNNMYFYEGNCLLQVPMFATDNRGAIQSLLSVAGAGVSLATGNPLGFATGVTEAVTQQKVAVGRAGTIGSNYGYMSGQEAFIVIERPIMQVPYNFGAFEGWTSNIYEKVSNLQGYTEIDEDTIWSDNFGHATAEECDMIKTIMNGGVYL